MSQSLATDATEDVALRWVAHLRMLHSLAARLNGLKDEKQIGDVIAAELKTLIDYHACRVYVLERDGVTLYPIALRGEGSEYEDESPDELTLCVGKGVTGHAAASRKSYYTPDAMNDPYAATIPGTDDLDESIMAVPLTNGELLLGVLALSKEGIDQFDNADLRLLELLGSHASVAFENARLLKSEREAAARARDSEARKGAILESALDGVIVIDGHGRIEEFSPAAERTFGYSRAEVWERELAELIIAPEMRARYRESLAAVSVGEGDDGPALGIRMEVEALRSNGSRFPVEIAITKVPLPDSILFTCYVRDITERKQAEYEIQAALESERQAVERLHALDDMKDMFLQAVSHDLRTPLTSILGITLTLERTDMELPVEDRRDLVFRLASNARRLDSILSNLLDLERLKRGVVEASLNPTDVPKLVRRMVNEADFLSDRSVKVKGDSVRAMIDGPKVERIVENLLVNAAKHTPPGTPIWVSVEADDEAVLIVVEDAGPGVDPVLREAIFEPFRQGPGDHASPGAGIGLSLVARFAALHGGRAWVDSRDGGGSSFKVRLPYQGMAAPR
jgi:PAS domain S-box-containing protein